MNMSKRLNKLEEQLATNAEAGNELEMTLDLDANDEVVASYCKIHSGGQRTGIDHTEAMRLMDRDDKCEVFLVD